MDSDRTAHPLFDRSREYAAELNKGLALSGERREFFLAGRVGFLGQQLGQTVPQRILDFGCGFGDTTHYLGSVYPLAEVTGVDTSELALDHATRTLGSERVRFRPLDTLDDLGHFDLCYVNGVFHHIAPAERVPLLEQIRAVLAPGGRLAFFENNPWNPGTRLLMKRLEFDRDALPISPPEACRLLDRAGFRRDRATAFLFWFPRPLAWLRFLEPMLVRLPLGAQYSIVASRS